MKTYKIKDVEVSEEQVRQLIKDNPELVKESTHKSKFFEPTAEERAYYLFYADFSHRNDWGTNFGKEMIARGVYRTKEEAEKADQKRMALVRLWNWAGKNAPFTPDWRDDSQDKYFARYDHDSNVLLTYYDGDVQSQFTLPYFASEDDVARFIKECEADLRIYCL